MQDFNTGLRKERSVVVTSSYCDFAVSFDETSSSTSQSNYQTTMSYLRENIQLVDINDQHDTNEGGKRIVCVLVKNKDQDKVKLMSHIESAILKIYLVDKKDSNGKLFDCSKNKNVFECINAFEFIIKPGQETKIAKNKTEKSQTIDKPPHVMCDIAVTFASTCCGINQPQYESATKFLRKKIKTHSIMDKSFGKEGAHNICIVLKNSGDKETTLEQLKKEMTNQKSNDKNKPDAKIIDCTATPGNESCIIPAPSN